MLWEFNVARVVQGAGSAGKFGGFFSIVFTGTATRGVPSSCWGLLLEPFKRTLLQMTTELMEPWLKPPDQADHGLPPVPPAADGFTE